MSARPTAQIIPFPRNRAPTRETAPPLTVSLASLSVALEEQRASVEAWRSAVDDLSACMKTLGESLGQLTITPDERH